MLYLENKKRHPNYSDERVTQCLKIRKDFPPHAVVCTFAYPTAIPKVTVDFWGCEAWPFNHSTHQRPKIKVFHIIHLIRSKDVSFNDALIYWDYMTLAIEDIVWLIGGMILMRKTPKNFDKIRPSATLLTINPTITCRGLKPSLFSDRPRNNHPSQLRSICAKRGNELHISYSNQDRMVS